MLVCAACGFRGQETDWRDCWCPRCGAFLERLYRRDHADQARAAGMTREEIRRECLAAGRPDPFPEEGER